MWKYMGYILGHNKTSGRENKSRAYVKNYNYFEKRGTRDGARNRFGNYIFGRGIFG